MIETGAPDRDEFYIGYEGGMPPGIRRRVVAGVAIFASWAVLAVFAALTGTARLPDSRFEFGVVTRVEGVLRRTPYPWLDVGGRRIWLAGPGKFGAAAVVDGIPDGPAIVEGSRIERGPYQMLEVAAARTAGEAPAEASAEPASTGGELTTLRGEIVDSKCFLGVMNPGEGIVHRDCAARCLSGGMTPMLLVRDGIGREELIVLVSGSGGPVGKSLAAVAGRPVEVTGRLARDGEQYVLFAESSAYRVARD